jgi:hypothetical protein
MNRIVRNASCSALAAGSLIAFSPYHSLAYTRATTHTSGNGHPAAAIVSLVPTLKRAKIPVYVPSWLPNYHRRTYPSATLVGKGRMYTVYLTTTRKPGPSGYILFWMIAEPELNTAHGTPVPVGSHLKGHVNAHGRFGFTVSWSVNHIGYTIGGPSRPDLLRTARSVIRVP